jgi:hypothetical protein
MDSICAKLPMDWVKRIFTRLEEIYGDKWQAVYCLDKSEIYLTQWSTALAGLTADEIKNALAMCQESEGYDLPTPIEFYHYAKGLRVMPKSHKRFSSSSGNPEVAKEYLSKIRNVLRGTL